MTNQQEHSVLSLALDLYAFRVIGFIRTGFFTHRALMAMLMEERLASVPDEADAILNLLAATGRVKSDGRRYTEGK